MVNEDEILDRRTFKIEHLRKVLCCSYCAPHRGENRTRVNAHKTRKSRNFQFVGVKTSTRRT